MIVISNSVKGVFGNVLRHFKLREDYSIDTLVDFNNDLRDVLMRMDDGSLFADDGYSQNEFRELLTSFVAGQRGSLGRTKPGSWSIVPDDYGMDSDVRVEFIFTPTYLVTAILSRTMCDYPDLAQSISGFEEALKKGMHFCTYRNLYGHGYDAFAGAAEALTILSIGMVPKILEQDKSLCPRLYKAIEEAVKGMQGALDNDEAFGMWGEGLQEEYSSALETLYVKNDREMYEAIMSADDDSELFSEEELPW